MTGRRHGCEAVCQPALFTVHDSAGTDCWFTDLVKEGFAMIAS